MEKKMEENIAEWQKKMEEGAATLGFLMKKIEEKDLEKKELEKKFSDQIAKMSTELEAVKDEKERVKMVNQLADADKQNKEVLQHLKDDMDSLQKQVDDGKEAMKHLQ